MNAHDGTPPALWSDRRALAVLGTGSALPGAAVATDELLGRIESRFGVDVRRRGSLIAQRLGIASRHISRAFEKRFEGTRPGYTNAELAATALRQALAEARVRAADLAYLITHTASPGELMPPNAARIAQLLGYHGPFVELRQACTGFANALVLASGLLSAAGARPVAIAGSETGSVYFDPLRVRQDHGQLVNLVQMGDAAAAIVLGRATGSGCGHLSHLFFGQRGIVRRPGFRLLGGGSDAPRHPQRLLEFEHDFTRVRDEGPELLAGAAAAARVLGCDLREVDYVIPHQANGRMAELLAQRFDVAPERVFVNAARVGNTGSAAIWLAFAELRHCLQAGQSVQVLGAEATGHMFGGFRYVHG